MKLLTYTSNGISTFVPKSFSGTKIIISNKKKPVITEFTLVQWQVVQYATNVPAVINSNEITVVRRCNSNDLPGIISTAKAVEKQTQKDAKAARDKYEQQRDEQQDTPIYPDEIINCTNEINALTDGQKLRFFREVFEVVKQRYTQATTDEDFDNLSYANFSYDISNDCDNSWNITDFDLEEDDYYEPFGSELQPTIKVVASAKYANRLGISCEVILNCDTGNCSGYNWDIDRNEIILTCELNIEIIKNLLEKALTTTKK